MKITIILILSVFLNPILSAQTLLDSNRAFYQNIFEYAPPGDVLLDIYPYQNTLSKQHKDSINPGSTLDVFASLNQLRSCSKHQSTIPSLDTIFRTISHYKDQGVIPIVLINYLYSKLDSAFFSKENNFYESQNQLNIDSSIQQHFIAKRIFLFSLNAPSANDTARFLLPSELLFSNNEYKNIVINFHDGTGKHTLVPDSIYEVIYPQNREQKIEAYTIDAELILDLPNGGRKVTTKMERIPPSIPDVELKISDLVVGDACQAIVDNDISEARISVRYGKAQKSSRTIVKPLIFVEGFDFDPNPYDETYGDINFTSIITGISYSQITGHQSRTNLLDMPVLVERLYNEDYDLIFIDFQNGSGDLFKNGNALIKLVSWINQEKTSDEELIILGASMGGTIARYAIRKMELSQCIHCVKLYGTFDSPHKGANIPLSIQYAVDYMNKNDFDASFAYAALESKAAQQLMIYNITPNASTERSKWQSWLNANGHPIYPKRIALSNGAPNGAAPLNAGDQLYKRCYKRAGVTLFDASLYAGKEGQLAFKILMPKGNSGLGKWINGYLGRNVSYQVYFPLGYTYFDHASGGQLGWINDADQLLNSIIAEQEGNQCGPAFKKNGGLTTFIPTYSSLDFYTTSINPDLLTLIPQMNKASFYHPFHSIFYHSSSNPQHQGNQLHVLIDKDANQNIDWIMKEIASVAKPHPNHLPSNSVDSIYNYNRHESYDNTLYSITIAQSGKLQLNGFYRTGFSHSSDPLPQYEGDKQLFRTSECGVRLEIQNRGIIEIGDKNGPITNKAVVHIQKGSVLILKEGAELVVHDGSTLIIEEGAFLEYHPKSIIKLAGANSSIIIRGSIQLESQSIFSLSQYGNYSAGILVLEETESNNGAPFIAHTNAKVQIRGIANSFEPVVRIIGKIKIPSSLDSCEISNSSVKIEPNSALHISAVSVFEHNLFYGDDKNAYAAGIQLDGRNHIVQNCEFSNLTTGIDLLASTDTLIPAISYNLFSNCGDGIVAEKGRIKLTTCHFINCSNGLIALNQDFLTLKNNLFRFNQNATILIDQNGSEATFTKNRFEQNQTSLDLYSNSNVHLECNGFIQNKSAINMQNSILNMSPTSGVSQIVSGKNQFIKNEICIVGTGEFYIRDGQNTFVKQSYNSNPFISLYTDQNCLCLNPSLKLDASENYWFPSIPSTLESAGTYFYSLTIGNGSGISPGLFTGSLLPVPPTICPNGSADDKSSNSDDDYKVSKVASYVNRSEIHVYPNPAKDKVHISLPLRLSEVQFTLIDMLGIRYVLPIISADSFTTQLDLSSMPAGNYQLEIRTNEMQWFTQLNITN